MSQKIENKQPATAAELKAHGLFKISAIIDLQLYKDFKSECAQQEGSMKTHVEAAIREYLSKLKKSRNVKE